MSFRKTFTVAAALALLAGCHSNSVKCSGNQAYLKAVSIDPITGTEQTRMTDSAAALKVPEVSAAARDAAAQPVQANTKRAACLDYPPAYSGPEPTPGVSSPTAPPPAPASKPAQ
jgi:hypothetical protein